MKFLGFEIKRSTKVVEQEEFRSVFNATFDPVMGGLSYSSYSGFQASKALSLSACYRAVNLIGDSISSLQLKVYSVDEEGFKKEFNQHGLYQILGTQPNPNMSRFNFFKLIISSVLLRGNAYIKVYRGNNYEVTSLEFLNPDLVLISLNPKGEIKYTISGQKGLLNDSDVIHIINFPQMNSLYGLSTITYASNSLEISYNSEIHAGNYFLGGANSAGFLSTTATLTPKQEADLTQKFKNASNTQTGNPNGITFMGGAGDIKLQTLGISPRDSQLLETRSFNVLDIARFFSVDPILLFSQSGTYNNNEQAQLSFISTTLLPIIEKIENEFTRKLILPSQRTSLELRFDLSNLLRADNNSRADYYTKLFNIGVMSSNQIARELNLPKIDSDGADKHFISTNLQDSDELIVDVTNSVDNKLVGDNKPEPEPENEPENNLD